jgi:hypothetical protein
MEHRQECHVTCLTACIPPCEVHKEKSSEDDNSKMINIQGALGDDQKHNLVRMTCIKIVSLETRNYPWATPQKKKKL